MNSNEYSDVYLDNIKSDFFVIKPNETINALMQLKKHLGCLIEQISILIQYRT